MDWKTRAKHLKKELPAICLALKHKATPVAAKVMAGITVGYALSPIDLIPDFIPVLGYLDDIILLPAFVALTIRLIPESVMNECRIRAEGMWSNGRPKKFRCAIPIILLWLLIVWLILKRFL